MGKEEVARSTSCMSCRLVSGLGVTGGGLYVLYSCRSMKGWDRRIMLGFGSAFCLLGLARLLDLELPRRSDSTQALATETEH